MYIDRENVLKATYTLKSHVKVYSDEHGEFGAIFAYHELGPQVIPSGHFILSLDRYRSSVAELQT